MFDMIGDLFKVASVVVTAPVAAVADIVTLGGACTDKDKPYTAEALEDFMDNLNNLSKPR